MAQPGTSRGLRVTECSCRHNGHCAALRQDLRTNNQSEPDKSVGRKGQRFTPISRSSRPQAPQGHVRFIIVDKTSWLG